MDLYLVIEPAEDLDEDCGINDTADYHLTLKSALKQAKNLIGNPFESAIVYKLTKVAVVRLESEPKVKVTMLEDN